MIPTTVSLAAVPKRVGALRRVVAIATELCVVPSYLRRRAHIGIASTGYQHCSARPNVPPARGRTSAETGILLKFSSEDESKCGVAHNGKADG